MFKQILKKLYSNFQLMFIYLVKKIYKKQKTFEDALSHLLGELCKNVERESAYFVSYIKRAKQTTDIPVVLECNVYDQCAIVLQGPIMKENDFTLETIKLYRRRYPYDLLIFSTWEDEDANILSQLDSMGVIVVTNKKPLFEGFCNVNLQMMNTYAGIIKAKEMGAKYICKTRSDQRLYHPNLMEYLVNLENTFPVCEKKNAKARIVCLGMEYGNIFYPFFMSDFFYFGTTEDMCRLFDGTMDTRTSVECSKGHTRKECSQNNLVAEIYFLQKYAENIGFKNDHSVKAFWEFVNDYLICVGRTDIGLYWPKYDVRFLEHHRNGLFYEEEPKEAYKTYNWDFIHWFNLYNGSLLYNESYEQYAEYKV